MSQWTHICGAIRLDFLPVAQAPDLEKIFGVTCTFDSDDVSWEKCNVPCGSEGSLQYKIFYHQKENALNYCIVYIWGDLRDYDDHEEIHKWLSTCYTKLRKHHYMIRDMVVKVHIEYKKDYLFTSNWNDEKKDVELVKIDLGDTKPSL